MVKNPPAVQETQVRPLSGEDPLEEETATHSSLLVWRIPWTEEHGGLQYVGLQESDRAEPAREHQGVSSWTRRAGSSRAAGGLCVWLTWGLEATLMERDKGLSFLSAHEKRRMLSLTPTPESLSTNS